MSLHNRLFALILLVGTAGAASADMGPPNRGPRNNANNFNNNNAGNQQANADAAAAVAGGFMCVVGVAVVIGIIVKVLIVLFIVSDARKRGMDPTLYVVLEIFVGIVGLIVYLCSREPLLTERRQRYARDYDGDEHDDDQPKRSRRYRNRDDDYHDRGRDDDY